MREILVNENRPMTDGEIVKELAKRDIYIVRCTVVKYRV